MPVLLGPFHVVLLVLFISGADKMLRPMPAAQALSASGLVTSQRRLGLGRAVGLAEISVAVWAFAQPSLASALGVAGAFSGFIWFVRRLRTTDSTAGCGCFGSSATPPGIAHQLFNAGALSIALVTAAAMALSTSRPDIGLITAEGFAVMSAYLVAASVGAMLFLTGPTLLADLTAAKSGDHTHRPVKTFTVSKAFKA